MAESSKKNNKGLVAVIILLLLAVGTLGYLLINQNTITTDMEVERERILFDLNEARREVGKLESLNDSMDNHIAAREAELTAMIDSVESARNLTEAQMKRWRTEAYNLRNKINDLEARVDSVNKAYELLAIEKEQTEMDLQNEMARVDELNVQNTGLQNELSVGAKLQLVTINAGGYKVYSSGNDEETGRARRADRVKTCFRLGANPISKTGERVIYMRVITPDLTVLSSEKDKDGENTFSFQGRPLYYSAVQSVFYENNELDVCMTADREDFEKGQYTVELYTDGEKLGEAKFVLD